LKIYRDILLDENGEISHNWITEFTIMKKAISKERVDIIKTENSPKCVINICKKICIN
jgi:hypothetical protein